MFVFNIASLPRTDCK